MKQFKSQFLDFNQLEIDEEDLGPVPSQEIANLVIDGPGVDEFEEKNLINNNGSAFVYNKFTLIGINLCQGYTFFRKTTDEPNSTVDLVLQTESFNSINFGNIIEISDQNGESSNQGRSGIPLPTSPTIPLPSPGNDPLKAVKDDFIYEITRVMFGEDPNVAEEELEQINRNWHGQLQNAHSIQYLKAIQAQVLLDINNKRQAKIKAGQNPPPPPKTTLPPPNNPPPPPNLNQVRGQAIQAINQELAKQPEVKSTELSTPDWVTKINQATTVNQIDQLRSQLIAEIGRKRATKQPQPNLAKTTAINHALTKTSANQDWQEDILPLSQRQQVFASPLLTTSQEVQATQELLTAIQTILVINDQQELTNNLTQLEQFKQTLEVAQTTNSLAYQVITQTIGDKVQVALSHWVSLQQSDSLDDSNQSHSDLGKKIITWTVISIVTVSLIVIGYWAIRKIWPD